MLRTLTLTLTLTGATFCLGAQDSASELKKSWNRYKSLELEGEPGLKLPAGIGSAMDHLAEAWAIWLLNQLPASVPKPRLPELPELLPTIQNVSSEDPLDRTPKLHLESELGEWALYSLVFPVPCGVNKALALYRRTPEGWRLSMLDSQNPVTKNDELGAREHVVVLLLKGPRVILASTMPWCMSCWNVIRLRVLAPGKDPSHPVELQQWQADAYRCSDEDVLRLEPLGPHAVRIRYSSWAGPERIFAPRSKVISFP